MSIENGVTTGAPKAAAQAAGHGAAKSRTPGAAPGGFASLLQNFGADEVPTDTALPGETTELKAEDTPLTTEPAADAATAPATDPALLALVPAPAASQAEQIIVPQGTATPALPVEAAQPELAPAVAAATGVGVDTANQARSQNTPVTRARAETPAWTQGPAAETKTAAAAPQTTEAQTTAPEVQPLLRQAGLVQRLAQQRGQGQATDTTASTRPQRGEDVAARLGWQISDASTQQQAGNMPLLAAWTGEATQRLGERRGEKAGARGDEVGAYGGVAQIEGARMGVDVPTVAPDGGLTTEMRVAEQVSYYVGRGAQSAELEIDGIDERPIHVSISLQGQEARVEFRAEQAQTRQVLQDAVPHLRELLENEGLVLSGVSVGSSGADGGQGQSSREREGTRQGQVAVPELAAVQGGAARGPLPNGRSVDLFV